MFRKTVGTTSFTAALMLAISCVAADVAAQTDDEMAAVMPSADRFEEGQADRPVQAAYVGDRLIGYVFRTTDWPPERLGYSGPIRALVGLDLNGQICASPRRPLMTVLPGGGAHDDCTRGDEHEPVHDDRGHSTTESVWNFLMDPLDVFRFRGMGDGRRVMPSLSQLFVVKVN
jgi:hypothetical protein